MPRPPSSPLRGGLERFLFGRIHDSMIDGPAPGDGYVFKLLRERYMGVLLAWGKLWMLYNNSSGGEVVGSCM